MKPLIPLHNLIRPRETIEPHFPSLRDTDEASSVLQTLNALLPEQKQEQQEDKTIQKTREILGKRAQDMSTDQVKCIATEVQYLSDAWLDDFEKEVFGGQTLMDILHERSDA